MASKKHATDPLLRALQLKLRERMEDHADFMAGGGCKDFPSYQKTVGLIEGLAVAERHLLDLDPTVEDED